MDSKVLLALVALFGVVLGNSRPTSFTDFQARYNPSHEKGVEIISPIEFDCPHNGAFAYPESCELFVDCWEGDAVLMRCTELMLFDLKFLGCNYAQYVDCQERPRPTDVPSTLTPPISTTTSMYSTTTTPQPDNNYTCPNDGVFPHEEKCEYYWSCFDGLAQLIHCQLDFLYDLTYNGCNYPELTHCQERERPEGYPPTKYPASSTTVRPTGTTPTTTTPLPTTTEEFTGTTDPNATTIRTTTTLRTTTEGGEFTCPELNGLYPDPTDCTKYYQCDNGKPVNQSCPDGLYFNPIAAVCDFPENVKCDSVIKRH